MTVKIAVIYDSGTGTPHAFAQVVAGGAASAGTRTRPRPVAEPPPDRVSGGSARKKNP
ncbi:hypothetical protein [Microbispora sp. NBRC 16548]|uniref:hypothetical protein n=1 Tax=Microbispora sp. NBRC 16548 TaxID=3030994 RepID=UPI0024A11A38|nr:hypothetical protein [Microbispora sp. NBRC 16548]GLX10392.1 hypothetical protein Misp03_73180 [Microbispora sp. NBRC 16548]